MGTVLTFQADLAKFADKVKLDVRTVVQKVIFDIFTGIVLRTPVDSGRAAGSWGVSKGVPTDFSLPEGDYGGEQGKQLAVDRLKSVDFSDPYGIWYITNNLPYIETLEFGLYPGDGPKTSGGFSTQAPAGMVRITLAEIEAEIFSYSEGA